MCDLSLVEQNHADACESRRDRDDKKNRKEEEEEDGDADQIPGAVVVVVWT